MCLYVAGLRALLRFLTGLYVCLNRGDVDPKAQQVFVAFTLKDSYLAKTCMCMIN